MDVTTAIAPMVVDITATALLSAGTLGIGGAAYVGAKQGATLTAKGLTKSMTGSILRKEFGETSSTQAKRLLADKLIRGSSDDVVKTIDAYNKLVASKVVGSKIVQSNAVKATQIGGLFLTSANRSAGATYGAVYTNLEGTHEEKHDAALGAALLGGMATGLITSSFSMFGAGGFEDAFLRGLTFNQQKYVLQRLGRTRLSDIDAQNIIKSHLSKRMKEITPNVFKDVYRRYLKGGTEEFVEEAIDEFVNSFIVDAALHRNTPMMERISGALYAGSIGGVIGQGAASVRSIADKSAAFKRGDIETFRQKEVDLLIEELGEDSPLTQAVLIDKTRELLRSPEGTVLPKEYVEAVESFDKGKTATEEKFLRQPPETIDAPAPEFGETKDLVLEMEDAAEYEIFTEEVDKVSSTELGNLIEDSKSQAAQKQMEIQDREDDNLDLTPVSETETETEVVETDETTEGNVGTGGDWDAMSDEEQDAYLIRQGALRQEEIDNRIDVGAGVFGGMTEEEIDAYMATELQNAEAATNSDDGSDIPNNGYTLDSDTIGDERTRFGGMEIPEAFEDSTFTLGVESNYSSSKMTPESDSTEFIELPDALHSMENPEPLFDEPHVTQGTIDSTSYLTGGVEYINYRGDEGDTFWETGGPVSYTTDQDGFLIEKHDLRKSIKASELHPSSEGERVGRRSTTSTEGVGPNINRKIKDDFQLEVEETTADKDIGANITYKFKRNIWSGSQITKTININDAEEILSHLKKENEELETLIERYGDHPDANRDEAQLEENKLHIEALEKALAEFESKLPEPHKSEEEDITPAESVDHLTSYKGEVTSLDENQVFVFGSNLKGFHGAGAAGYATFGKGKSVKDFQKLRSDSGYNSKEAWPNGERGKWNVKGQAEGLQDGTDGTSYALPTKQTATAKRSLSPEEITENIRTLYATARSKPDKEFLVAQRTKMGLSGWTGAQMAKMYLDAGDIPSNIVFEEGFHNLLKRTLQAPASDTATPPVNIEEEKIDQGIHDESTKAYEGYSRRREELIAAHAPARDAVREKELALEAHIDKAQKIRRDAGIKSGDSQLYLSFEGQTYGKYSDILADTFEKALPEDEVDTRDSRGKRQGFDEDNQQKRKQNRGAPQSAEQTEDTPQAIELAESRRTFLDEEKEIHGELLNAMEELQIIEDDIRQFEDYYATSKWREKPWVKSVVPTFYTTDIGTSLARKISAKSFVTILKDPTPLDVADALGRQLAAEERGRTWQQALDKADELKAELDNPETSAERKEEIEREETYPKHRSANHKEAWEKTNKLKEELAAPKTTKKRKAAINKLLQTREKKGIGQEPPTEVVTKKGELPDLRAKLRQEKNNSLMGLDLDVANADELALDAFNEYKELQNKIPPEVNSDVLSLQAYAVKMIPERGNPNAHYWFPKEQVKAAIATQFIGEGKEGSSTDRYRSIYDDRKKANTGVYNEHDIIFVASNGRHGQSPVDADGNVRGEYKKIDEAIGARARFVMDTEEHLKATGNYNTGEVALETYLKGKGYVRKAGTGLWSPAPLQRGFAKEDLKGAGFEVSTKGTPKVGRRYSALNASIPVSELGAFKDFLVARYGKSILKRFNPEKKKSLTVEYLWMAAKGYPEYTNKNKIGKGRGAKAATEGGKFPYWATYKALWKKFFKVTEGAKEEIGEASSGKILTDQFAETNNNQARAIHEILVEEGYRDPDTLEYLGADVEVKFPVLDTKLEPSEVTETIPRRHLRAEIKLTEDAMASALAARNTEADNYVRLVQSFGKLTAESKDGAKGKDILNNIQEVRVKLALAESRLTNNRNKLEAIMLAQLNDPEVAAIKEASLAFSRYEALSNDASKKRYDEKEYIELMEGTAAPALSKEEDRGAQNSAEKVKIREAGVSSYNDLDEAQKKEVQDIHRHISEAVGTARTFGLPYRVLSDGEYEKSVAEDVDYKAFSLVQLKGRSTILINPYKVESLVAGKNFLNARSIVRSEVMEEVIHAAVVHEIGSADKGAAIGETWDNLTAKEQLETITTYYPKEADATAALDILNGEVEVQEPQVVYMGSVGAVKTAPKEAGINVLRQEGEEHFGNPFSDNEGATRDTIPTGSLAETVAFYEEWLNGTAHTDVKQERRAWVLEQIDNGVLEGANLLYFTDGTSDENHAEKLKEFATKRMADNKVKKQKYILGHEYLRMEVQKVTAGLTTEETNDLAGSGIANVLKQYLRAWLRRLSHFFRRDRNNPYVAVAISRVVETLNAMEGGLETQSLPDFDPNSPEDSYNVLNNQFEVGGLPLDGIHGTILESRVEGEKKETLARHGNLAGMLTIPILTTGEYRGKYKGWRKWMNSLVGSVDPRLRALHQSETNLRNTAFREIKKYQIILKGLVEKYYPDGNAPVELFRDITGNGEVLKLHKKTEDAINDTFAKIYAKISEDKGRELHELREEAKLEGGKKVDDLSLSEGLIEKKHYDRVLATHKLKDEFIKKELGKQRDMIAIRRNAAIEALGGFEEDGETPKGEIALHLLTLRDKVDAMSEKIKELYPESTEDGDLAATIDHNMEVYLTRGYQLFSDAGYAKKVMGDSSYSVVRNNAAKFFEQQYIEERGKQIFYNQNILEGDKPSEAEVTKVSSIQDAEAIARAELEDSRGTEKGRPSIITDMMIEFLNSYAPKASGWLGVDTHDGAGRGAGMAHILSSKLKRRKDIPEVLRAFMGQEVDPTGYDAVLKTYLHTSIIASHMASMKTLLDFGIHSDNKWILQSAEYDALPTKEKENWDQLKVLGDDKFSPFKKFIEGNETKALYVPKDLQEALETMGSATTYALNDAEVVARNMTKVAGWVTGTSMAAKTLGSVGFYIRNALGNVLFFGPAQGMLAPIKMSRGLWKETVRKKGFFFGGMMEPEQVSAYYSKLERLGILEDELRPKVLEELLFGTQSPQDLMNELEQATKEIGEGGKDIDDEKFLDKLKDGKGVAGKAFTSLKSMSAAMDSFYKIYYYENELSELKKARAYEVDNNLEDGKYFKMSDETLENLAATKVKKTAQSYSQASPLVQGWSASPIGMMFSPFIRFKGELVRITVNSVSLIMDEVKDSNPVIRKRGLKRLTGMTGVVVGASAVFPFIARMMSDVEDEEDAALRKTMVSYLRGHTYWLMRNKDGDLVSWDLTYLNPFSLVVDPFLRSIEKGFAGESPASMAATFTKAVIADEFLDEQIFAGALTSFIKNRDPETNKKIWEERDEPLDVFTKGAGFLLGEAFEPRMYKAGKEAFKLMGTNPVEDALARIGREFLPAKPYKIDLYQNIRRYLYDIRRETQAISLRKNKVLNPAPMDDSEIKELVLDEIDHRIRLNKEVANTLKHLTSLGRMTDDEVKEIVHGSQFGKRRYKYLLQGRTETPKETHKGLKKKLRDKYEATGDATYLRRERLLDAYFKNMPRFYRHDET